LWRIRVCFPKAIKELLDNGYEFILGARLKSAGNNQKEEVLALQLENGESASMDWEQSLRMIMSYSEKRGKKDGINREKGPRKLEKQL